MADPCVADSDYIALDTAGTPAVLTATLRNPAESGSATQGDYTSHTVNDHNVVHTQTQTFTVDNSGGTASMRGIVVATMDPIWIHDGVSNLILTWHAQLVIGGVVVDERNKQLQTLLLADPIEFFLPPAVLVGQIDVVAGGSVAVVMTKTVENTSSGDLEWTFVMGGDKLVVSESF
jgi:hypothetical protein